MSHHGTIGGKHKVTSQAVTTAERSPTAIATGRLRRCSISASAATAVIVEIVRFTSTPGPMSSAWATIPGISATSTRPIVRCTLTALRT